MKNLLIVLAITFLLFIFAFIISSIGYIIAVGTDKKRSSWKRAVFISLILSGVLFLSARFVGTHFVAETSVSKSSNSNSNDLTDDDDTEDIDTDSSSSSSSSVSSSPSSSTEYPNISSIFDLNTIESQNSSSLFKTVELKDFNIVDMGADSMKQYHLLISPNGHSDTYFLAVFDHKLSGKLDTYNTVTIDGTLNGKSKLDGTQVNTGISSDYLGKKVILINVDKVSKK